LSQNCIQKTSAPGEKIGGGMFNITLFMGNFRLDRISVCITGQKFCVGLTLESNASFET
jgi:hypothetical protein